METEDTVNAGLKAQAKKGADTRRSGRPPGTIVPTAAHKKEVISEYNTAIDKQGYLNVHKAVCEMCNPGLSIQRVKEWIAAAERPAQTRRKRGLAATCSRCNLADAMRGRTICKSCYNKDNLEIQKNRRKAEHDHTEAEALLDGARLHFDYQSDWDSNESDPPRDFQQIESTELEAQLAEALSAQC